MINTKAQHMVEEGAGINKWKTKFIIDFNNIILLLLYTFYLIELL